MTTSTNLSADRAARRADAALRGATTFWYLLIAVGQWLFLAYILVVYGGAALRGDLAAWNQHLAGAYVPGASLGNLAAALHLFLALIILGGGPLQLAPQIRNRFRAFHRWLGRSYLLAVVVTALAGLYLLLHRDIGGAPLTAGFVLQVIMILGFAALALRNALRRDFAAHRRWALRLFMVASAVWFFRVILMAWMVVSGGVGVDMTTGKGPFLDFMAFGQYLPLLILEIYLRVKDRGSARARMSMAVALVLMSLLMAAGTAAAFAFMWWPSF